MESIFISAGVTVIIFLQGLQIRNLWKHEKRINMMENCLFGNPEDATSHSLTEQVKENNTNVKRIIRKLDEIMDKL